MGTTNTTEKLFWVWLTMALIILITLLLVNDSFAETDLTSQEQRIVDKMERKYLGDGKGVLRFRGDAEIDVDERISGDVLIVKGTLDLQGEVNGDVLAVFGDVELGDEAVVNGDVIAVNGKVWTEDESEINGDIVVTHVSTSDDDDDEYVKIEKRDRKGKNRRDWPNDDDETFWLGYNRVDGFSIGFQFPQPGWYANRNHNFAFIGKGGYSFGRKDWQYQLGLQRWIGDEFRFGFGGEFHNMTASEDNWIICDHENTAAAFFIRKDFKDYYRREGYSLFATQNFGRAAQLKAGYYDATLYNLPKVTNWSLFGGDKKFRNNPAALPTGYTAANGADAGLNIKSAKATLTIDTRDHYDNPRSGWYIQGMAEHAGEEFENEIEFQRLIVDIRRYQPLSWDETVTLRLRGGTSTGILPPVYFFDLGGMSTLRGFDYKEFTGDRMVLGNLEYRLRAPDLNFMGFDIILFVDSGLAWFANEENLKYQQQWPIDPQDQLDANEILPEDTFEELTWGALKTNVGVALATPDNGFRVNFARRTDRGGGDFYISIRICQAF